MSTLGLTAAGAASAAVSSPARPATIGTTIATTSQAGYEASGRDFRYISSTLTVPDTDFLTGIYPQEYIQLSNGSLGGGDQYVRAGIESCVVAQSFGYPSCPTGDWTSYVEAFNNSLNGPYFEHYSLLSGVDQGDGVNFSIYYDEAATSCTSSSPRRPPRVRRSTTRPRRTGRSSATPTRWMTSPTAPGLRSRCRSSCTRSGSTSSCRARITTENGLRGSFVGPWTTSMVEATSNGLTYPSGTVRISPSTLWSDGLTANGAVRPDDAFGVWAR